MSIERSTRTTPAYRPCGCGCRKEPLAHGTVCPCKECQPGPGIDHMAGRSAKARARNDRMKELLNRPEEDLDETEAQELDGLLNWYIHRM